jgi:hypothetical protein
MDQQRLDSLIEAMIETPERHTLAGETSAKRSLTETVITTPP